MVTPPPPPPQRNGGFHLIQPAVAEPVPFRNVNVAAGKWGIQVGAFASASQAEAAIGSARQHARVELAVAHPVVASVHQTRGVLWRARLTGLSRETATQACEKLSRGHVSCMVLSPDSQS